MKKQLFLTLIAATLSGAVTGIVKAKLEGQKQTETPQQRFCRAIMPTLTTIITEAWNIQQLCNTSAYTVTTNGNVVEVKRTPATNTITTQVARDALTAGITATTNAVCELCNNGTNQPENFQNTYAPGDQNIIRIKPVFLQDPFADSDED